MPMIAFIGVRISWLIAARKVLLAWLACSAASRASRASANSRAFSIAIAACCDSPTRKSRSACGERRRRRRAPDGHHADDPSRPTSGATISRSSGRRPRCPGSAIAAWIAGDVVDDLRPRRRATTSPMIPSPSTDRVGQDLRRRSRRARRSARKRLAVGLGQEHRARVGRRAASGARSAIRSQHRVRDRASPRSRGRRRRARSSRRRRRCASRYSRAFWIADADVGGERRRAGGRPPRRSGPPAVVLWTLIAPIASSPTRIGTPR